MTLRTDCLPKVRLTSTWGASMPWEQQDEWQRNANSYRCTLYYKGRRYSFDYWQGIGISHDPRADDVLDSLLSDAQGGEQPLKSSARSLATTRTAARRKGFGGPASWWPRT